MVHGDERREAALLRGGEEAMIEVEAFRAGQGLQRRVVVHAERWPGKDAAPLDREAERIGAELALPEPRCEVEVLLVHLVEPRAVLRRILRHEEQRVVEDTGRGDPLVPVGGAVLALRGGDRGAPHVDLEARDGGAEREVARDAPRTWPDPASLVVDGDDVDAGAAGPASGPSVGSEAFELPLQAASATNAAHGQERRQERRGSAVIIVMFASEHTLGHVSSGTSTLRNGIVSRVADDGRAPLARLWIERTGPFRCARADRTTAIDGEAMRT